MHVPVQPPSQQTPSAHTPLKQSESPPTGQVKPLLVLHAPLPSQATSVPEHVPTGKSSGSPSAMFVHVPTAPPTLHAMHVSVHAVSQQTESTQLPLTQSVPPAHASPSLDLQLPAPSQETVVPEHVVVALVSSCPEGTLKHVPTLPVTLHAMQVFVHAVSQQTPSTQLPLEHWAATVHTAPLPPMATQTLATQA